MAGAGTTSRRRRKQPEQAIQKMLVDTLRMVLPRNSFLFAVPNGGARNPIEASIFQGQGVVPGVPDLMILYAARAFGIEVKAADGALTDKQKLAHEAMERAGVPVAVVRTLPEALDFLRSYQIPLRNLVGV